MPGIGSTIKTADFKNEKHVPVIEAPAKAGGDAPIDIKVSVSKEIAHPNTTEHFIAWMELYYQPDGGPAVYHLGRADFTAHGATTEGANSLVCNTEPVAVFKVKLAKPGTLFAMSYCNIHGLWESSARIEA